MSCPGDNYVVPGANICGGGGGGSGSGITINGSGSADVSEPTPGNFIVDVPAIPTQNSVNEMYGNVTIESADGSIVVENDFPNLRINLRPFFNVITGSFLNPQYIWSGPPSNDLTMSAQSVTTFTGTWMFFYQASVGPTGWSPLSLCYTRWTAGSFNSQNVRQVDMGVVLTTLEHSNSFIVEFGAIPRTIQVSCVLNNITYTANPAFSGIYYSCKLCD